MGKVLPSRLALLAGHNLLILRYAPSLWGDHVNQCLRRKCQKNQVAILLSRTLHRSGIFVGFVLGFQPKSGRGKSMAWDSMWDFLPAPNNLKFRGGALHGHGMGMAWAGSWHSMGSGMGASAQIWALHGSYPRACCCCFEVMAATPLGFSRVTMVFLVVLWGLRCRLGISWASHEILIGPSRVQEKP